MAMDVLHTLAKLPPKCAARNPSDNTPIIIWRGSMGYSPAPRNLNVDAFNKSRGITPRQRDAMLYGSCFGWDAPIADPDNDAHDTAEEIA